MIGMSGHKGVGKNGAVTKAMEEASMVDLYSVVWEYFVLYFFLHVLTMAHCLQLHIIKS